MSDMPVPLIISCEGDFLIHLFAIPGDAKVADLVTGASSLTFGVHIPASPASSIRIRRIKESDALPNDATVTEAGLGPMDWLHLYVEQIEQRAAAQ